MRTYTIDRSAFTNYQFYDLIGVQEIQNLPNDYQDIFDDQGEIKEEYQKIFNVDIYKLNHDNVRITDWETLEKFLLDYTLTPTELDEDIKEFIASWLVEDKDTPFQLAGDGDGLGFIVDVFDPLNIDEDCIDTRTYYFEDYDY